ncbi:Hypothetical predicted protein [Paramuricea clavata]|uniref:Uncharacterized protein n=1 Tax=Paramuricea clavata TaxID=317549 RepID=A0A6S7HUC7_PARCT|nr:Hypothetical predicted protein [Paramuricea clavata]
MVKKTFGEENCPFHLVIKIDSCNVCSIDLGWEHNHSTDNLEASNSKDLCTEVIDKIKKLYEAGHTPSTARQQYHEDLRVICKDDMEFHVKKADRSSTLQRRGFRYIYEQFGKETFGGKHDGMFHKLVETMEQYKACNPEASVDYQLFGGEYSSTCCHSNTLD